MMNIKKNNSPLLAIAVFIGFFGLLVASAAFVAESFKGKMTNLTCGLVFLLVAYGAYRCSNEKSDND